LPPVLDLLFRAKHLFVAAMMATAPTGLKDEVGRLTRPTAPCRHRAHRLHRGPGSAAPSL
jgi:hypothetical protein